MDRLIKKKQKEPVPDWVIYSLKGLLLFLLFWNLNKHLPDNYFGESSVSYTPQKINVTPYIEEISYSRLLGTTQNKPDYYINWGNMEIPFQEPDFIDLENPTFTSISKKAFEKIYLDSFSLHYKGHLLRPNKINAIFINPDSTTISCEDEGDFTSCFYPNLNSTEKDFALLLSVETEEKKTFYTRLKISNETNSSIPIKKETSRKWTKIINKSKHKYIDNLTVVKPIFRESEYHFKWGDWERYVNGPRGGRRVEMSIEDLKSLANFQPFLYHQEEFIPFQININSWDSDNNRENCYIIRRELAEPMISTNYCFKSLIENLSIGDGLSIFIFIKEDFIKTLTPNTLRALPGFIFNDQFISYSIPIEVVEKRINRNNAPLKLTTSTFGFQLNSSIGEKAIVKMDTNNPRNNSFKNHYTESESARIVHIDEFKTIRRVITSDDLFISADQIDKSYTLTEKVFVAETFPEFYDFNILPPLIKFRGLSTVLDKTVYNLSEFKAGDSGLELFLGDEQVKILQVKFTVVPKEGKATEYITNHLERQDILKRLKKLQPETSLYFENIVFERTNGEQMVFPLTTVMHLK